MKYPNITKAIFLSRPNRFIAQVSINGIEERVHVKNTGRCKELLIPGATVYLVAPGNPERKTKYDLIAVEKIVGTKKNSKAMLVNMDSQVVNAVAFEWLKTGPFFSKNAVIRKEYTYGKSRFDFYIEDGTRKIFLEAKGVTLEDQGVASFPDAPTERGVKHIKELQKSLEEGYEAYILFVIQMKPMKVFKPNDANHKAFGDALREASKAGVRIIAMDCLVTPESIQIQQPVSIDLS